MCRCWLSSVGLWPCGYTYARCASTVTHHSRGAFGHRYPGNPGQKHQKPLKMTTCGLSGWPGSPFALWPLCSCGQGLKRLNIVILMQPWSLCACTGATKTGRQPWPGGTHIGSSHCHGDPGGVQTQLMKLVRFYENLKFNKFSVFRLDWEITWVKVIIKFNQLVSLSV